MRRVLDWWVARFYGPRTKAYNAAHHNPRYSTQQDSAAVTTRRKP